MVLSLLNTAAGGAAPIWGDSRCRYRPFVFPGCGAGYFLKPHNFTPLPPTLSFFFFFLMGCFYLKATSVGRKTTRERFFTLMPGAAVFPATLLGPLVRNPSESVWQETPPGSFY